MTTIEARAGAIGQVRDEIAQVRAKLDRIHADGAETIQRARDASTAMAGEALVIAARDQIARVEANLRHQLAAKNQRLDDLRRERNDLLEEQRRYRKFIAEHETEVAARYERVLALIDQAWSMLDGTEDWEARDHLLDAKGKVRRLPDQLREARGHLYSAERKLAELGEG